MKDDDYFGAYWEDACQFDNDYKIMIYRTTGNPTGYLKTFNLPITIPNIIEQIGLEFGGGAYQLRIVDANGKCIKSKGFDISGLPKAHTPSQETIPDPPSERIPTKKEINELLIRRSLSLLERAPQWGSAEQLEIMKFIKELYKLK